MSRLLISCAATSLTACLAAPTWATTVSNGLDEIVISASRTGTPLEEMPLHTTVVDRAAIDASPSQTLDDLLRHVPSLLLPGSPSYTTDPTGHNIKFRGMDKKVLVLLDGVPVLDPFYTTIQWYKVPLSHVERVEIVRGGGSSLWGNLAVGGVINIVSRRPDAQAGEAALSVGSDATWNVAARQDIRLTAALGLELSADAFGSDGYNNAPTDSRAAFYPGRDTSAARRENVRAGLYFHPDERLDGFLRVGYHEQNERIGGYQYGSNLQRSPDLQAALSRTLTGGGMLAFSLYAQDVGFDKYNGAGCYAAATYVCGVPVAGSGATAAQQTAPVLQYASSFDHLDYRERGGSATYTEAHAGALAQWQIGLDYRRISGGDAQQTYRTPTAALPQALRIQRANDGGGAQSFIGLFAQIKWRPVQHFELQLSARGDRFGSTAGHALQTNYSNVTAPVAAAPSGGAVPDLTQTTFDPSLSLRYELTPTIAVRASGYKAFRAPGLNNLYRSFGSSSISIANPLLKPETLVGAEAGLDWRTGRWSASLTAFQAQVDGVVATYRISTTTPIPDAVQAICGPGYTGAANTSCPGTVSFYTNGQDQRATGLEFDASWAPLARLAFDGYATYTDTYYTSTTTGDPTDAQLPLVPHLVAGLGARWQPNATWNLKAQLRYNSAMTLSSLTSVPLIRQGGYAVANFSAVAKVNAHLQLAFSLTNAGAKQYTDSSASNVQSYALGAPRAYAIELRARW